MTSARPAARRKEQRSPTARTRTSSPPASSRTTSTCTFSSTQQEPRRQVEASPLASSSTTSHTPPAARRQDDDASPNSKTARTTARVEQHDPSTCASSSTPQERRRQFELRIEIEPEPHVVQKRVQQRARAPSSTDGASECGGREDLPLAQEGASQRLRPRGRQCRRATRRPTAHARSHPPATRVTTHTAETPSTPYSRTCCTNTRPATAPSRRTAGRGRTAAVNRS